MTKVTLNKESAGNYYYHAPDGASFEISRVISDYGDVQWVVDIQGASGRFSTMQTDTLTGARRAISLLVSGNAPRPC